MTISRQYQKRKTPPRGMTPMKKLPGSMPKMPTLDLPPEGAMGSQPSSQRPRRGAASGVSSTESLEDGDDDETGGDKEDERRMAEIIIKLQLAKQKAAETKKRKQDEEAFLAQTQQFEKENAATINGIKRTRINELKKLRDRRSTVLTQLNEEISKLKQLRSEHSRQAGANADEVRSVHASLANVLSMLESRESDVKNAFFNDYSTAKQEVDRKLNQLRDTLRKLETGNKSDKFASIIEAIVKSFE